MNTDSYVKRRRQSETITTTIAPNDPSPPTELLQRTIARFGYWRSIYKLEFEPECDPELNPHYRAVVDQIETRKAPRDCELEEFQELLSQFDNPQDKFATIHVTGTNGKGSVCCKIADQLQAYGLQPVGLFTSPHINTIRERFCVDGQRISCLSLVSLVRALNEAVGRELKFFHLCTLLSFLWFHIRGVKVAVIEVGIGGARDPTNVIRRPACCIITSIGLDHQALLGSTEVAIARDKAGIIKQGAEVIVGPHISPDALAEIRARALQVRSNITVVEADQWQELGTEKTNGHLAREAVRVFITKAIDPPMLQLALPLSAAIPDGRLQHLLPHVVIDGGHNAPAMREIARYVMRRSRRIYLGIALSRRRGLRIFNPLVDLLGDALVRVEYVHYHHPFARPYKQLLSDLEQADVLIAPHLLAGGPWPLEEPTEQKESQIVNRLLDECESAGGLLLLTGTFYFVGTASKAVLARGAFFEKHTFC